MPDEERSPLVREALRWFAIMGDDEVSDADRQAFERWKGRSEHHLAAWERASSLWSAFAPVEAQLQDTRRRKLSRRAFLGAGLAMLAAGSGGYRLYRGGMFAGYTTGTNETLRLTLEDGSTVELGSQSALSVDYSATQRRLLLHRGEAHFAVAPDRRRPFIVAAAKGETRALGTQFNIHTTDDLVTVTVVEHAVEVSLSGITSSRLEAGWQISYAPDRILAPAQVDLASVEAWRRGRLIYRGAPLRRVLNDIERYRGGFVILTDKSLANLSVSAAFDTSAADEALDSIALTLPISVTRIGALVFISGA